MPFLPNNTHGKGRIPGSKNRKTIVKESFNQLAEIGITPLETSKEIINSLTSSSELKNSEQIQLLNILTNLFKYTLLTRSDEVKLDDLLQENEILEQENQLLKDEKDLIFQGSPQELIQHLKKEPKEDEEKR